MRVQVGESTFTDTLEDNAAVDTLVETMENGPVTIQMSDYGGFEKVGALGTSLPTSNSQTTKQAGGHRALPGQSDRPVLRFQRLEPYTPWKDRRPHRLGGGDVSVTFSLGAERCRSLC